MISSPFLIAVSVTALVMILALVLGRRPPEEVSTMGPQSSEVEVEGARQGPLSIRTPKERSVQCRICMGRIKLGQGYAVCPCGQDFHRTCVERTGYCPYCKKEYSRQEFKRRYNIPEDTNITLRRCPVCGDFIPREARICDCGAVFLGADGSFSCPSCKVEVAGGDLRCGDCGVRFKEYNAIHCKHCGLLIPEGENVCECGTLLDDNCPDCGWRLGKDDERCPICGLVFEFVRD